MSFLQPLLLAALPIAALPILIHLINQRRFQTIRWAAMIFLLAANRMSRGYARLRQWLILAFRTLAILGLIVAISRPLSRGWLGLAAGGRADTTIILLDRSPSMSEQGRGTTDSKLQTGRSQLANSLGLLGSARWVLIESTTNEPREIESPSDLLRLPDTEPASAAADVPSMLQSARDYIRENKTGRTEIWICSDIRQNDWNADSGRWQALRDSFLEFPQAVRFHLLAYGDDNPGNVAIRVTDVRRQTTANAAELLVSLVIERDAGQTEKQTIPVQFEIEGARSEVNIDVEGAQFELKDYRIPIERRQERGWGKVSIPADANPADNEFYFVFDQPIVRRTIVVAEDPSNVGPLQLTASISPNPNLRFSSEVIAPDRLQSVEWEQIALVLWQAPLPQGEDASLLQSFLDRGGAMICFPPREADGSEFLGLRWAGWVDDKKENTVETWRSDEDLLRNTQSGSALGVGKLQIRRFNELSGDATSLASLRDAKPLLVRATTDRGSAYFCSTTVAPADSSLALEGVVLYAMVQRAIANGVNALGTTRQIAAGDTSIEASIAGANQDNPLSSDGWQQLAGSRDALSTAYRFHAGVYDAGGRLLAINRPAGEDRTATLADDRITELFRGLDFIRVDDRAGSLNQLIQEIWRLFLLAMLIALIGEAILCMPSTPKTGSAAA